MVTNEPNAHREAGLSLRPARYDDPDVVTLTAEVQAYYRRLYGGEDTNPISADEFAAPSGGFLLGRIDSRPVVMGGWRLHPEPSPVPGTRPAELRRMFVRPEFRGRGYARQLLIALEGVARAAGADLMILETGEPQVDALAFYAHAGYRPVPAFGHWADTEGAVHLGRQI